MQTKTQLKIMEHLIDNEGTAFGIRELARNISTAYYLVQRNVQQLKEKNILLLRKAGKTDIVSLHPQANTTYLIEAEKQKRESFYNKYPHLKVTLQKIVSQAESCFFVLLVFGSYAKRPRKDSDLDILVIVPDQEQADQMQNTVSTAARTSTVRIHETIVTEMSYRQMLQRKDLNIALEAKSRHVLIYGEDQYYRLQQ